MTATLEPMSEAAVGPCADVPVPPSARPRLLVRGSVHPAVRDLQRRLNDIHAREFVAGRPGIDDAPLLEDCIFGKHTLAAVLSFQRMAFPGVTREHDGKVGPKTWAALDAAAGTIPFPPAPPIVPPGPPTPPAPAPTPAAVLDPTRWRPIIGAGSTAISSVHTGNAVTSLIDGWDTYREMVSAIRSATSSEHVIYLLGWSLVDDFDLLAPRPAPGATARPRPAPPGSETVQKLLGDASARGVQIRAMLWDQPGTTNTAEVGRINGLATGGAILDDETPNPIRAFGSHHQKVLVVHGREGLVAFVGGLDINIDRTEPVSPGHGNPQHDDHCRILGPAAFDLLETFRFRWEHHPGSAAIDRAKGPLIRITRPTPFTTPPPGRSSIPGTCSVRIARTFNPTTGRGPARCERDIQDLLVGSIRSARRFIYLEDQYLISRLAATELNRAVRNLAHVTILTTASEILAGSSGLGISGGLPCVWKMRRDFVADLTAGLGPADVAKLRIFVLATPPVGRPPTFGFHTYVHAKSWVFDDELAVIGSANCNRRSWTHDSEVDAFIVDDARPAPGVPTFAQQYRMQLWAEHLGVAPASVADGVASAALWVRASPAARIMRYDPTAARDAMPDAVCDLGFDTIDPLLRC